MKLSDPDYDVDDQIDLMDVGDECECDYDSDVSLEEILGDPENVALRLAQREEIGDSVATNHLANFASLFSQTRQSNVEKNLYQRWQRVCLGTFSLKKTFSEKVFRKKPHFHQFAQTIQSEIEPFHLVKLNV